MINDSYVIPSPNRCTPQPYIGNTSQTKVFYLFTFAWANIINYITLFNVDVILFLKLCLFIHFDGLF